MLIYCDMNEFVVLTGEEQELWEIDYERNCTKHFGT
jgi:RIO-like serine/threonine protein kinase